MSVSSKLKNRGEKEAALPARPAGACQNPNCTGIYIPVPVGLYRADGKIVWGDVCYKPTCMKCGRMRRFCCQNSFLNDYYFSNGSGFFSRNLVDFWVPRELIEEPVFDKSGAPVLDKNGKQILSYNKDLKIIFVKKLLSLVNEKSLLGQYFTLEQIYNAKI